MAKLTFAEISQLLKYDPKTGKLFWLPRPRSMFPSDSAYKIWTKRYSNKEAFTAKLKNGYLVGTILGDTTYKASHVAWLLSYGRWPSLPTDHINGDRSDNRLINLREVTITENNKNKRLQKKNISGKNGVSWNKKYSVWDVSIGYQGKKISIGSFRDLGEAIKAREKIEHNFNFHENHGNHRNEY